MDARFVKRDVGAVLSASWLAAPPLPTSHHPHQDHTTGAEAEAGAFLKSPNQIRISPASALSTHPFSSMLSSSSTSPPNHSPLLLLAAVSVPAAMQCKAAGGSGFDCGAVGRAPPS